MLHAIGCKLLALLTLAGKSLAAGIITSPAGTLSPYTATGSKLDILIIVRLLAVLYELNSSRSWNAEKLVGFNRENPSLWGLLVLERSLNLRTNFFSLLSVCIAALPEYQTLILSRIITCR